MHLIPNCEDTLALMRQTGALRDGHFEYRNGLHSNQHLELPLALRYHPQAKKLTVGLSRLVRANPEIRPMIRELSVVAATIAGLPVAYGLCEALEARQVYWSEKGGPRGMRFPQFLEHRPGEKVLLVDDILRSGRLLHLTQALLESEGCQVVGVGVLIYQPTPKTLGFGALPLYYLARLEASYYADTASCTLCRHGVPLEHIELDEKTEEACEGVLAGG